MFKRLLSHNITTLPIALSSSSNNVNVSRSEKFYPYSLAEPTQNLISLNGSKDPFYPNEYVIYDNKKVIVYPNIPMKVQFSGNLLTVVSDFCQSGIPVDAEMLVPLIDESRKGSEDHDDVFRKFADKYFPCGIYNTSIKYAENFRMFYPFLPQYTHDELEEEKNMIYELCKKDLIGIKKSIYRPSHEDACYFMDKYYDPCITVEYVNILREYVLNYKYGFKITEPLHDADNFTFYTVKATDIDKYIDDFDIPREELIILKLSESHSRYGILCPKTIYLLYSINGQLLQVRDTLKKQSKFFKPDD